MSLLLDALHRASKDKEKAALVAANAAAAGAQADGKILLTPPPGQAKADFPKLASPKELLPEPRIEPPAPAPQQPPAPLVEAPLELQLELEPNPLVAVPPENTRVVESRPTDSVAPSVFAPTPPLPPVKSAGALPTSEASAGAALGASRAKEALGARPNVKAPVPVNAHAAASAIQNAYAAPTSANTSRRRRVFILGGVATCLSFILGSILFGLWGDPERLLGLSGTSSVAVVSAPMPAPAPEPPASTSGIPAPVPAAVVAPVLLGSPTPVVMVPVVAVAPPVASLAGDVGSSMATPKAPVPLPNPLGDAATAARISPAPAPVSTAARPSAAQPKELVLRPNSGPPVFSSKVTSQGSLEQGYAALLDGRLDDAALAYGAALAANPMERDALLGLAYVAHSKGRRDEAQTLYRKVLRLEPGNSVANAGLIALEAGTSGSTNSERAKSLAARQPDSAAVQALAASALVQDGLLAEAALAFVRAQGLEPTNPWHSYNLAVALDKLGNFAQALEQYDKALQNRGRSPTPLGKQQVESARLRATQLQQSLERGSETTND